MNALAVTFGTSTRSKTFGIRQSTRDIDLSRDVLKNRLTRWHEKCRTRRATLHQRKKKSFFRWDSICPISYGRVTAWLTTAKTSQPTSPPSTLIVSTWPLLKISTTGLKSAFTPPCSWIGIWTFAAWWICIKMPMASRVAGQRCLPLMPNSAPRSRTWIRRLKALGKRSTRRSRPSKPKPSTSGS